MDDPTGHPVPPAGPAGRLRPGPAAGGPGAAATSFQPIDAAEVADQLARLATGLPSGRVPDMGGPHIRSAADLLRTYLHAAGRRRLVLPIRLPSAAFAGYRRGGHLAPDRTVGRRTWSVE